MMRKILILAAAIMAASASYSSEIIKNSAGDKIELKDDGTWVKIKPTSDDYVNDGVSYTAQIEDGNRKMVDVTVRPDITLMGVARPLTKEEMNFQMRMASISAQFKLKNRFSYMPREVYIIQKGRDVKIRISYTGENSFGGSVASNYETTYYIEDNGKLKKTTPNF